jgi:pyridoxine 5-phosphate synthase
MIRLGVNIDHVATLRQARLERDPSPLDAAVVCEKAGADLITVHLREDRRHIQDHDVKALKTIIKTALNLEMASSASVLTVALKVKPDQVTLVPEKRQELTTEGGLDAARQKTKLMTTVKALKKAGIKISLFIEPAMNQVFAARELGAEAIEFHTGRYAKASSRSGRLKELNRLKLAASEAHRLGLKVHAGHGLTLQNIDSILELPNLSEVNIGFSIISQAIFVGLFEAVKEMKEKLRNHATISTKN